MLVTERAKPCPKAMSNDQKKWYAVYTRPRWEKKVHLLLLEKGVECYCPLNRIRRKWSDRMKWVEEPLFKSYIFVKVKEKEKADVRMTSGVVNFVYWNGKPGIVKDKEIDNIRNFLNEYTDIEVYGQDIQPETRVRIESGIFMDREAKVLRVDKKRVELEIESLGYILVAYTDTTKISSIKK